MKRRCIYDPNKEWFKHYAGRGIRVCERWKDKERGFQNFLEDMGVRPEGMTLDRRDVDGNYEKSNCRWATPKQQHENRRTEEVACVDEEEAESMEEWEERNGVGEYAL